MSIGPSQRLTVTVPRGLTLAPAAVPRTDRPTPLRLVPQRSASAARAPFIAVVVALLVSALLGLLVLNTVLAQGAFRLHVLQSQGATLADHELALQRQVEALRAPADLAQRAAGLGLVPGGPPGFLRLSDGAVLGKPGVAAVVPAPLTTPAAAPTAPTPAAATPTAGPAPSAVAAPTPRSHAGKTPSAKPAPPAKAAARTSPVPLPPVGPH